MLRIVFFPENMQDACGLYRCHIPAKALEARGHRVTVETYWRHKLFQEFDIFVFARTWKEEAIDLLDSLKTLGKTIVYDIDDKVTDIPQSNPAHLNRNNPILKGMIQSMKMAHMITVTTEELAQVYRRYNPNISVLPNCISGDNVSINGSKPQGQVLMGWSGSITHYDDLREIVGVPEEICRRYPQVKFCLIGYDPKCFKVPPSQFEFKPMLPFADYLAEMTKWHIALAPVADNTFNHCKSDLKYLDYAMCNAAVIASDLVTYKRSIQHGKTGFLAHRPKDWITHISRLVENPELRDHIAHNAKQWVLSNKFISSQISLWEEIYEKASALARPDLPQVKALHQKLDFKLSEMREQETDLLAVLQETERILACQR